MAARIREVEGEVVLEVVVDEAGNMVGPILVKESVPLLDAAAIDALKQWRFSPARDRNGNPVRVILDVPLHFVLD
jgi:periplasmic protein TonB